MYDSPFSEDVQEVFTIPAANAILLKVSYWLSN
jgi:hypothetical protein